MGIDDGMECRVRFWFQPKPMWCGTFPMEEEYGPVYTPELAGLRWSEMGWLFTDGEWRVVMQEECEDAEWWR